MVTKSNKLVTNLWFVQIAQNAGRYGSQRPAHYWGWVHRWLRQSSKKLDNRPVYFFSD